MLSKEPKNLRRIYLLIFFITFSYRGFAVESSVFSVSLMEAVQRAQESYAKVRVLRADRNAQIEKVRGSWADLGPRVKLDYTQSNFEQELSSRLGESKFVTRPEVVKQGSMTILQPVTGLGALTKKALYEETQLEIKQDTFILTKAEGAFLAAERWLRAYQLDQLVKINEGSVLAVEQQLRDAQALERVGRLNRGDVLKLEYAVSEARMRVTQNRAAHDAALADLNDLLGIDLRTPAQLQGDIPNLSAKQFALKDAVEVAHSQRLEKKVNKNRVELAEFGKSLAYSQFSPQVNLFVKADRNFNGPYQTQPYRINRSYGINISWDIWNNGSHIFALREAADRVAGAIEASNAEDSRMLVEVQNSFNGFKAAKVALALAETALKQAHEAFRIESLRFKTGTRSATDLVLAESSHAQAKGNLISAKVELANNYFRLQKSMGQTVPQF